MINGTSKAYKPSSDLPTEIEVSNPDLSIFVASPNLALVEILERLATLEERDRQREEEMIALREENARFRETLSERGAQIVGLEIAQDDFEERVTEQFTSACYQLTPRDGTKTAARVEELKERLKRSRGRATFSDLRGELGLSKSQFSQLVRRLDKRVFDVRRHPRNGKEKILSLRQQIRVS